MKEQVQDRLEDAIADILAAVGVDPTRNHCALLFGRSARALKEILSGYSMVPDALINGAYYPADNNHLVIVRNVEYFSICEHHLLPFFGKAQIAYVPDQKVIGLAEIPRIVEMYARRLQIQERMTNQIAELLMDKLSPHGVAVVVVGEHLCSRMRGVKELYSGLGDQCVSRRIFHQSRPAQGDAGPH